MRLPAILMIGALALMIVSDANAQEASIPLNVDAAAGQLQRTPTMVVHEVITIPQTNNQQPLAATGKIQANAAKGGALKQSAAIAPGSVSTPPIVLSSASGGTGEMQSTGNQKYDELIAQSAARNGVDPNLIVAVMRQESGFNPRARSYKGATGLMQLMPATAARFGVTNIYEPSQNIEGGARYLRFLLDSFNGDVNLVLAGYNAGENAVVNSGYRVPRYRETQNYVRSISARYDASKNARSRAPSPKSAAPAAAIFSGGAAGSRLSNNY